MSKKSLYLRYRPQNFENLIGQDHVNTTLRNAIKTNTVAHSYLFTGPRGTGKTSSARLIAKALNCENLKDGSDPCDQCSFCVDINEGKLIDLIEIDAASNRGIDEVRDLKEKINFAPSRSKYKIYIVDEVHMMTKEAFNALLKTLEEPPDHAYFILATTEIHKIPETIISRCQRFDFRRLTQVDLKNRLSHIAEVEGVKCEDGSLEMIAKYVDGGMRDAIGLLEQLTDNGALAVQKVRSILGVSDLSLLNNLFTALVAKNAGLGLKIIDEVHAQGSCLRQFCHDFIELLRGKMLDSVNANQSPDAMIKMIEIFEEAKQKIGGHIPQLALEIAVVKIAGDVKEEAKKPEIQETREDRILTPEPAVEVKVKEGVRKHKTILTMASVSQHWGQIIDKIKTPSLRMSVKSSKIVSVENADITLEFATSFHREKVMANASRVELEEIIKEVFGDPVKVIGFVGEGYEQAESEVKKTSSVEELDMVDSKSEDQMDEALDIFGGEVVV